MNRRSAFRRLLAALVVFGSATFLFADGFSEWFAGGQAKAYLPIRPELQALYTATTENGVPGEFIIERISEGAAKKIPAAALLAAIRTDCGRFVQIIETYEALAPTEPDPKLGKDAFLSLGAIILRSGVPFPAFFALILDGGGIGAQRKLDALLAVAAVHTRFKLADAELEALSRSLARSGEKTAKFSQLSSVFVRGRSGGLKQSEMAELAVAVFDRGGNIFQLENEISWRIK